MFIEPLLFKYEIYFKNLSKLNFGIIMYIIILYIVYIQINIIEKKSQLFVFLLIKLYIG